MDTNAKNNEQKKVESKRHKEKIRTKREPKQLVRAVSFGLVVTLNKNGKANEEEEEGEEAAAAAENDNGDQQPRNPHIKCMHTHYTKRHTHKRGKNARREERKKKNKNKIPRVSPAGEFDSNSNGVSHTTHCEIETHAYRHSRL